MPIDVVCDHLKHTKKCFVTNGEHSWAFCMYIDATHCVKLLLKHLETNFKHLLGMEFEAAVIFLILLSVNNDLVIYVFATGVSCEITYLGSTEMNNVPYISAKVTCTITFSGKET